MMADPGLIIDQAYVDECSRLMGRPMSKFEVLVAIYQIICGLSQEDAEKHVLGFVRE